MPALNFLEPNKAEQSLGIHLMVILLMSSNSARNKCYIGPCKINKVILLGTWPTLNIKMALLKKGEYTLMITTFLYSECDAILCPALNVVLPAIGINHPWHDTWTLWPLQFSYSSLVWFSRRSPFICPDKNWAICLHYRTIDLTILQIIQIQTGFSGKILTKKYFNWAIVCTPTGLRKTWQYASEQGWEIVIDLPSLQLKCKQECFLMEDFLEEGVQRPTACGSQSLSSLVASHLWCQISLMGMIWIFYQLFSWGIKHI